LEAFGTGAQGKEAEVFAAVQAVLGAPSAQWSEPFARIAWRLHVPSALPLLSARVLDSGLSDVQRKLALDTIAFTPGREAAESMIGLAADKTLPLAKEVLWWLNNRRGSLWKPVGLTQMMRERGLLAETPPMEVLSPEPPARGADFPKVEDVVALTGDASRGQASAGVCYACHKIGSQGVAFGPDLTSYGANQPAEVVVKAILNPSADIAFNFEGSRIETTEGVKIDGILLTKGDPTVIKCAGGVVQSIAEDKIKSITRFERSLMAAPETLGLNAQGIADIVAYLKSGVVK
jgi:putative heme-binding domain-containing protein